MTLFYIAIIVIIVLDYYWYCYGLICQCRLSQDDNVSYPGPAGVQGLTCHWLPAASVVILQSQDSA